MIDVKVRIGVAIGGRPKVALEQFAPIVEDLDRLGFDSVWIPETFLAGTVDPLVGLSFAAARVDRLKLGTHIVTPGRNAFGLAKALAQLDRLSGGRLLLTFVAGINDPRERLAQGLPNGDRTTWFDQYLPRMRAWWAGDDVDGLKLDSTPAQEPLEVWLGGQARTALERVGRLGDGWLPGAITIAEAITGRKIIDEVAARHHRAISPEHFGINLAYSFDSVMPELPKPPRGTGDPSEVTALGGDDLRRLIGRWVEAGFSKIVVRPLTSPTDWSRELQQLAETVAGLQM